jgi:hypothetical protein
MTDVSVNMDASQYENTVGEVGELCIKSGCFTIPIHEVSIYAGFVDVSPDTVRRWIQEGKLIGIKVGGVWYVQTMSFVFAGKPLDEFPF